VLLSLPLRTVRKAVDSDATVASRVLQAVARRRWDLEDHVERLLFRTVESRLAERILALAAQYGQPDPRGTLITLKVTHAEMSRAIGATRETVTLTLGALRRRGLIDFDRRRILVRDATRLAKLV
jgi:CRP-like cAMP-binding protein